MPPLVVAQHRHLGTSMPSGGVHPIKATSERAEDEARRLALQNPGHEFYVLAPRSVTAKTDVTVRRFDPTALV